MKTVKKDHVLAVRVSEDEFRIIKQFAAENHQSISRYMAEAASSRQDLSLSKKQSIYSSLLFIRDAARQSGTAEGRKIINEECDSIWKSLSN